MKPNEVNKLSDEEIKVEVKRLRREIYDLRTKALTEKIDNTKQPLNTRRDLARVLTEQNKRTKAGK